MTSATVVACHRPPEAVLTVIIVCAISLTLAFHDVVVAPCLAMTRSHTVTDNLGNFYTTSTKIVLSGGATAPQVLLLQRAAAR